MKKETLKPFNTCYWKFMHISTLYKKIISAYWFRFPMINYRWCERLSSILLPFRNIRVFRLILNVTKLSSEYFFIHPCISTLIFLCSVQVETCWNEKYIKKSFFFILIFQIPDSYLCWFLLIILSHTPWIDESFNHI